MVTTSSHPVSPEPVGGDLLVPGMTFNFDQENNPNARILLPSIRRSGYTLETALGDLIDNSLDAGADFIAVDLTRQVRDWTVSVADNGCGMDRAILDQMLRLGSDTEHDLRTDLGRFGLGSTTASLSLGRRLHVITTAGAGKFLSGATDLDVSIQSGKFVKHLAEAQPAEIDLFKSAFTSYELPMPLTGTCVLITKVDNIGRITEKPAVNALKRYIGETYRYFIDAGKRFYVNGERVDAIDPLERQHPETSKQLEDTIEYVYPEGHARAGDKEKIGCIVIQLPNWGGGEENKRHGQTIERSGFYIMRNRREIVAATTLGLFTRHTELIRFRVELLFPASMDEELGVSFLKSAWDVKPTQSLKDKLAQELLPYLRQARTSYQKSKTVADDTISHDEASRLISQRAPFLRTPLGQSETRGSSGRIGEPHHQPAEPTRTRSRSRQEAAQSAIADRVEFKAEHAGRTAPIYEAALEGRKLVVTYNVDHPFYERFLVENRDNRSLTTGLDYLVYSLATAEIRSWDEQTYKFIERMREDMSFNLRQLLTT